MRMNINRCNTRPWIYRHVNDELAIGSVDPLKDKHICGTHSHPDQGQHCDTLTVYESSINDPHNATSLSQQLHHWQRSQTQ